MRFKLQRQLAEAGGWQVRDTYKWKDIHAFRGVGGQVKERDYTTTNATDEGGSRIEGGNENNRKPVETGVPRGLE